MQLKLPIRAWVLSLLSVAGALTANAQAGFFEPTSSAQQARTAAPVADNIRQFSTYRLRDADMRRYLAKAPLEFSPNSTALRLEIPLPNGTVEPFAMLESPILAPAIAAQHPDIKTYTGRGLSHPAYTIRLSFTSSGFDAIILGVDGDAVYYTKVAANDPTDRLYRTYFARDVKKNDAPKPLGTSNKCGTDSEAVNVLPEKNNKQGRVGSTLNNTGTTLRTFRLAVAATGEFTQKRGGTVQAAFNSLVGYVNRMNAVYRTELSVAFSLVSGTNLVYPDTLTDPYSNSNQNAMLTQNQTNLTNVLGAANYDVGHVFGYGGGSGGGIASKGSVCVNDRKGQGVSGVGNTNYGPIDPNFGSYAPVFDDQLISHEVGHQFGMDHTFNSSIPVCTTREATTSVEPGAGTTIMSYGFTCGGQSGDDYESGYQPFLNFHTVSYTQAVEYINQVQVSCFSSTALNNAVPVIGTVFPVNTTIPKSTPFELTGAATDANSGDVLSYQWEGTNIGLVVPGPASITVVGGSTLLDTTQPPFFRSYLPVSTGTRTFPRLDAILNGTNTARGDKLPSVGIATTHRLTVRDNAGGLTYREVTVTVDGNSGPFLETTNLAGSYPGSSSRTITWSVNNTNQAPVNCTTVNILLSTDGGLTFPTTLVANTPNDGSEAVTLPNLTTNLARIRVASGNNIFFDISNANFTIIDPNNQPPVAVSIAAQTGTVDSPFSFTVPAFTDPEGQPLTYTATGLPASLTFNSATRVISGTPTALGTSTVRITATDPASATASTTFTLTINAPTAIPLLVTLTASTTLLSTIGSATLTAAATGGRPPFTYNFNVNASIAAVNTIGNRAIISDVTAGVQTFTVVVTDNTLPISQTATATVVVTATAPGGSPVVKVNSTDPSAGEGGTVVAASQRGSGLLAKNAKATNAATASDPGVIRFERSNSTGPLVVNYQIGGTATNGVDFAALPTSVTFADGQSVLTEEIDPIEDDIVEGDESIIITLVDSDAYDPDPNEITTTVTLRDNDSPASVNSLTITSFACTTTSQGLSSVNFTVGYSGGGVSPAVPPIFINGVTASGQLGQSYNFSGFDNNVSSLTVQDQASRSTYFVWNFRAACASGSTPTPPQPPTPPAPNSLTVTSFTCNIANSVLSSVNFVVGYGNGGFTPAVSPIFINGVTASGQLGQSYSFSGFDGNVSALTVQDQTSRSIYFVWNFRAACTTSAGQSRLSAESESWQISVAGNPASGQLVVLVDGAEGQSLTLELLDVTGRVLAQRQIRPVDRRHREVFEVSTQTRTLLLLRAVGDQRSQTLKVITQ